MKYCTVFTCLENPLRAVNRMLMALCRSLVSIDQCGAAARSSQSQREQPTEPWDPASSSAPAQHPRLGPHSPLPNSDDFAKMEVLFVYPWRAGEPMSPDISHLLAISFIENKSFFFWPCWWQQKKVFPWVATCRYRWVPRSSLSGLGPLPMVSFLLMNMLFVLF